MLIAALVAACIGACAPALSATNLVLVAGTPAYTQPGGGHKVTDIPARAPMSGAPQRLLVTGQVDDAQGRPWVRVLLAQRPNGSFAWVPADRGRLVHNPWRVVVDRGSRRVTVFRGARRVRTFAVVVGAASTPTPSGSFAIHEIVDTHRPGQFVGRYVMPLAAFSRVLQEFGGGPGQIALHGRGGASLATPLGTAASHGCIRIASGDIAWLAGHVTAGTPVVIH